MSNPQDADQDPVIVFHLEVTVTQTPNGLKVKTRVLGTQEPPRPRWTATETPTSAEDACYVELRHESPTESSLPGYRGLEAIHA